MFDQGVAVKKRVQNKLKEADLERLKKEVTSSCAHSEEEFKIHFMKKYGIEAKKHLRKSTQSKQFDSKNIFFLGLVIGILLSTGFLIVNLAIEYNIDMDTDENFKAYFPIYRGYFCIVLFLWLVGANVYVWKAKYVNYQLAFEFSTAKYSTASDILGRAACFSLVLLVSLLCYFGNRTNLRFIKDFLGAFSSYAAPLLMWTILFLYFFNPFRTFNKDGRTYTWQLFYECLLPLSYECRFRHVWFADQLTSFISPLRDMMYSLCFYLQPLSGTFIKS